MVDPNVLFYEIANFLLTLSWIGIAFMLWRVRHLKLLDGGCPVIVWTLLSYALIRGAVLFGYQAWDIPIVMAVASGLTITSAAIIMSVLARVATQNPAPAPISLALFKALPPEVVKVYAEIKHDGCDRGPWNTK